MDAPFHFAENGRTVDLIPVADLIGPCKVVDVIDRVLAHSDGNYEITKEDILRYEEAYGDLSPDDIVVFKTGWHRHYVAGPKLYLGFDESVSGPYDSEKHTLCFPGIGADASQYLVSRSVKAVGIDTGKVL